MSRVRRRSACLVAAAVLVLVAACASPNRRDSRGEYVSDNLLTARVQAALLSDSTLKSDQIRVETYRGVVRLSGFVDSTAAEDTAVRLARGVDGVKSVRPDTRLR